MNSWNEGYFTESTYTYGYYHDISPTWQSFCVLANNFIPPPILAEGGVHCELGYGQGVSINIHAAATDGKYFGTDFNPSHAANANELLQASGADAKFFDDSFEEFLNRDDLPQFDSISLHGIWSWISAENQKHIVEFARKFLKPGGIFYNSYNCYPGWSPAAPMRELFVLYDNYANKSGKTFNRVEGALKFVENLFSKNPAYFGRVPDVAKIFESTKKKDHDYLAHEYFNKDWICMYFSEVAEIFQSAKLDFVCTSEVLEAVPQFNFPANVLEFLDEIESPIMREQVKDYFLSRQFRKDIYVRGSRRISQFEVVKRLLETNYISLTTKELPRTINLPIGALTFPADVVEKIQEYLAGENFKPKNFIEFVKKFPQVAPIDFVRTLLLLVQTKSIFPCQDESIAEKVKGKCVALNKYICNRAKISDEIMFLASPVLGGAYSLNRFDRIFLAALYEGKNTLNEMAQYIQQTLQEQGLQLRKADGNFVPNEESISEFEKMAKDFSDNRLPTVKALQII